MQERWRTGYEKVNRKGLLTSALVPMGYISVYMSYRRYRSCVVVGERRFYSRWETSPNTESL